MGIFGWVYKQSWFNVIVWYGICTLATMVATIGGLHHGSLVWIPFTIMVAIKAIKNPKDKYKLRNK